METKVSTPVVKAQEVKAQEVKKETKVVVTPKAKKEPKPKKEKQLSPLAKLKARLVAGEEFKVGKLGGVTTYKYSVDEKGQASIASSGKFTGLEFAFVSKIEPAWVRTYTFVFGKKVRVTFATKDIVFIADEPAKKAAKK